MSHTLTTFRSAHRLLSVLVDLGSYVGSVALLPTLKGLLDQWLTGWQLWTAAMVAAYVLAAYAFPEVGAWLYGQAKQRTP